MMLCEVELERLHVNEQDLLMTAAQLNDNITEVLETNAGQQTCDDLQTQCNSVEKDARKPRKKRIQKMQDVLCDLAGTDAGSSSNVAAKTINLRLTLKKVKVENGDKEEDACLYVCHTKKPSPSKRSLAKCADRSTDTVNKITSRTTKDHYALTDSRKVIYTVFQKNRTPETFLL